MNEKYSMSHIYRPGNPQETLDELNGQLVMLNQDIEQFRRRGALSSMMQSMTARVHTIEMAIANAKLAQKHNGPQPGPALPPQPAPASGHPRAGSAPAGRSDPQLRSMAAERRP